MAQQVFGKHMVWTVAPGGTAEVGLGYSSLAEAQAEAVKLGERGYKILRIVPTALPKPNS
ncbi:MAG: hypothetical protein AB7F22_10805 [Reyranella sp.]|uniref:hypothetical protein n=1 Tax=Reyranella sp. TaxID=1929291 RepID=UPI003D0F3FB9